MRINISVTGSAEAQRTMLALGRDAPKVSGDAIHRWAEGVMADSKANYVPVDTGALRASGTVQPPQLTPTGASVTMGYGGAAVVYALVTHENPRAGKTMGLSPSGRKYKHWARTGQWKFLEEPVKRHVKRLALVLAQAWTTALRARKRAAR